MSDQDTEETSRGLLIGGLITFGVGVIFLLSNLRILPNIGDMWPLIPIVVGLSLIISSFYKGRKSDQTPQSPG